MMEGNNETGKRSPCSSTHSSENSDNLPIVIKRKISRSISSTISTSDLFINTSPIAPVLQASSINVNDPLYVRSIERANLSQLSTLIIKHVLDSAVKSNRILDAGEVPLVNLFIILEGILLHGLRNKKTILGVEIPQKDVFVVLDIISQLQPETLMMSRSVKELPHVKSSLGKTRAWLRLAFMSKKLAEYFGILVENKSILCEYYSDGAFMLSEEAHIFTGHMTGLTIVECNNWCVRDEDLDKMPSIIDLKPYLRSSFSLSDSFDSLSMNGQEATPEITDLKSVLDQKNYLEEMNHRLMNKIKKLENFSSKGNANSPSTDGSVDELNCSNNISENSQESQVKSLAKQLDLVTHMKSELETAMQILERDVHEKQDTIIVLRQQLDDVKTLNVQMYHKMKQHENDLKSKEAKITELNTKLNVLNKRNMELTTKVRNLESANSTLEKAKQETEEKVEEKSKKTTNIEHELKIEREKRTALKKISDDQQTQITKLTGQLEEMQQNLSDYNRLKMEFRVLQKKCNDYDKSLEEVGNQLME